MNSRQRVAIVAGLVVLLVGVARAVLPFDERTGRAVFQQAHCGPPAAAAFHRSQVAGGDALDAWVGLDRQNGISVVVEPCLRPARQRVTAGILLMVLAAAGAALAVRVLRDPEDEWHEVPH